MSTPAAPLTFDDPVTEMWANDIQAKRVPDPLRALNSSEMLTFSTQVNAEKILQLAKAVTPDARLINGPADQANVNFIADQIDTAVTYQIMHDGVDFYPWAVVGTYKGAGIPMKVVSYVAGLVREHMSKPDSTALKVTITGGKADYDWV